MEIDMVAYPQRCTHAAAAALMLVASTARAGAVDEIYADGFEDLPDCEALRGTPACPGFALTTAPIPSNAPGSTRAACYFFRAPNTDSVAVRELESSFGAGVARIVVHATLDGSGAPTERFPPGTIVAGDCESTGTAGVNVHRIYQAHEPVEALTMPSDDGNGDPVALVVAPQQPLAISIHRISPDVESASTAVDLVARGLPRGRAHTPTATYVATNVQIVIPSGANNHIVAQACDVPPTTTFWWFSTHTHKQGILARIQAAPTLSTLVESSDWEAPAIQVFSALPFFTFGPGERMRYECTYSNQSGRTITFGADEDVDEQCVAVTYFFPATRPLRCVNSTGPF